VFRVLGLVFYLIYMTTEYILYTPFPEHETPHRIEGGYVVVVVLLLHAELDPATES